jgi:tRNA(Ser,Leu) C12 N-acetylase TAN1
MLDWNVIVTVQERGFVLACELLEEMGQVKRTGYYNVLAMKVENLDAFLPALAEEVTRHPDVVKFIGRVATAQRAFTFSSADEFEAKAREAALAFAPRVAGRSFHVRMHRRGFKHRLSSQTEEQFLDHTLLEAAEQTGAPARVSFEDPDVIIAIDTMDNRVGMSLWTRDDLHRYPFLKLD